MPERQAVALEADRGGGGPRVSVAIVEHNGADYMEECLRSLAANSTGTSLEVIVVDNASSDDSVAIAERCAAELPVEIRVVRHPVNRNYAGGANVALEEARGELVGIFNVDITFRPGWLEPLVAVFDERPEVGAVTPLMLLAERPDTLNAAGLDINVSGLGFNRLLGQPAEAAGTEPFRVPGLQGGAFLIRRELFERIGGWEESGWMYHDDVQLSWLLQLADADVWCVPASVVTHDYHLSMHADKLFYLERNRLRMLLSNLRWGTLALLTPALALAEVMTWGYALLKGPRYLLAKLRAYRWVLGQRGWIGERRRFVSSLRRRADREIVSRLRWGYPLDQFATIGREPSAAKRREIPESTL